MKSIFPLLTVLLFSFMAQANSLDLKSNDGERSHIDAHQIRNVARISATSVQIEFSVDVDQVEENVGYYTLERYSEASSTWISSGSVTAKESGIYSITDYDANSADTQYRLRVTLLDGDTYCFANITVE